MKSCFGRFDILTFQQVDDLDAGTATEAAAELKARMAAFHKATGN